MITLDKLKSYLRIDADYEDDLLVDFLKAARAYLKGAVSKYSENYSAYPEFAQKADLLTLVLATELYQNRDSSAHDMSYTVRSMIAQLQNFVDTSGNGMTFAMFDSDGNLVDSGIKIATEEEIEEMLDEGGF